MVAVVSTDAALAYFVHNPASQPSRPPPTTRVRGRDYSRFPARKFKLITARPHSPNTRALILARSLHFERGDGSPAYATRLRSSLWYHLRASPHLNGHGGAHYDHVS